MKCEDVNNAVVLALLLSLVVDVIVLIAELTRQRCKKEEEQQKLQKENELNAELDDLRKRVNFLERQIGFR